MGRRGFLHMYIELTHSTPFDRFLTVSHVLGPGPSEQRVRDKKIGASFIFHTLYETDLQVCS